MERLEEALTSKLTPFSWKGAVECVETHEKFREEPASFFEEPKKETNPLGFSEWISEFANAWKERVEALQKKGYTDWLIEARLGHLEEIVSRQEATIKAQGQAIALLQGREVSLPPLGEFEKWLESEEATPFAGKHVAYLPGTGVVATADSLDDLSEKVQEHLSAKDLILDFVPGDYHQIP